MPQQAHSVGDAKLARAVLEVARTLQADYLVSAERADKLSGAWGRHPLLGRMYLPAYRAGTELVARLDRIANYAQSLRGIDDELDLLDALPEPGFTKPVSFAAGNLGPATSWPDVRALRARIAAASATPST